MKQPLPEGFENKLREALLDGSNLTEAAHLAGVSKATACRWLAAHRAELTPKIIEAAARSVPALRLLNLSFRPLC